GDSPNIGAGSYADSRYGACAGTHSGEMAIRCSTASSVVLYMKMGMSVKDGVLEAVIDLRHLKTGYLVELTSQARVNQAY
ncbi:isoaspartyl peptidase/L-asparaginase, partial [Francisella tularensis]|uniref:isoaspartyl peptidase/L-asparaginase n=1 Tax=Francisella tularensis TaxID=263 RepID=UPI0023819A58